MLEKNNDDSVSTRVMLIDLYEHRKSLLSSARSNSSLNTTVTESSSTPALSSSPPSAEEIVLSSSRFNFSAKDQQDIEDDPMPPPVVISLAQNHYILIPRQEATNTEKTTDSCGASADIYELQDLSGSSKYSSYFCDNTVIQNGDLTITSRIDPLFLVLKLLFHENQNTEQTKKWTTLSQVLAELPWPIRMALRGQTRQMLHLYEKLDIPGEQDETPSDNDTYVRFSEERALTWLHTKVTRATRVLRDQRLRTKAAETSTTNEKKSTPDFFLPDDSAPQPTSITPLDTEAAVVTPMKSTNEPSSPSALANDEEAAVKLEGLQLICNYLTDPWINKLLEFVGGTTSCVTFDKLQERKSPDVSGKKRSLESMYSGNGDVETDKLRQYSTGSTKGTALDDVKSSTPQKSGKAQSHGLKKLAKVNTKGMKSLSSFFGAKKKKTQ
mmetsp:Transcript_28453/g.34713  ORF Transcript_28453/g.34713 Transcript_28453/m.34713 type:complete len:440 (+) Transcript_28453:97-1416(+)